MYLKSPRRRRDKNYIAQSAFLGTILFSRYRCVSKMASPEAEKNIIGKIMIFRYNPSFFSSFSFLNRRFLKFGPRNPSLFSCHARSRLNPFKTLDLKIFGNKALKSIVVYLKSPRRRREKKNNLRKQGKREVQSSFSFFSFFKRRFPGFGVLTSGLVSSLGSSVAKFFWNP